jgi:hypothetical protein
MIPRCAVIPFIGWIKAEFENAFFVQIEALSAT